jgi:osmotically inducible protein OsmC
MAATRVADVTWDGGLAKGKGVVVGGSGAIPEQEVTWASRTERSEGRTSPEELLAMAHASCFAMATSHEIAQAGGTPVQLKVHAEVTIEPGVGVTGSDLTLEGSASDMDEAGFRAAAEAAKAGCPISGALSIPITLEIRFAGA